jgi:hypothetical protein
MSNNVFVEALSVGLTTALVGLFISTVFMFVFSKKFTLKKYKFWPQIFFSYFVTGFVIHLIYEWTGMNKKFCCDRKYSC